MPPDQLSTRAELLGAGLAAALDGPGALWGPLRTPGGPEIDRLDLLLAVKRVTHRSYAQALRLRRLSASERELLRVLEGQEEAHVAALRRLVKARGGVPAERYRVEPPRAGASFLEQALELERWEIGALTRVAERMRSRKSVEEVANLAQVDARHAAGLRIALGRDPLPDQPFVEPLPEAQIRRNLARHREPEADEGAEGGGR